MEVDEKIRQNTLDQLEKELSDAKGKLKDNLEISKIEGAYRATKQEIQQLSKRMILSETKYQDLSLRYGQIVKVGIGAEAIFEILKNTNLDQLYEELNEELKNIAGVQKRRVLRRLRLITWLRIIG